MLIFLLLGQFACVTEKTGPYTSTTHSSKAAEQYVQLGISYMQEGNMELATARIKRALELRPNYPDALAVMGLIYQTEQEAGLAEKYFKEALDADSRFTRGRTYLASLYYSQRKLDDALKQFRIASEDVRYPNRAQVFSNLGLIESLQGRTADAIVSYRKSLTLDRNQPPLRLTLASLYAAQEEYVQANVFYAQFRDMVRTGGLVHTPASLELGIDLARRRGDLDTVSSLMLVLKNLYPDSAEYRRVIARADS